MRSLLFLSLLLCLSVIGCQSDDNNLPTLGVQSLQLAVDGCEVYYSFGLTTTSYIEPALANTADLLPVEQALSYPTYDNCHIEACLNSDGTVSAEITILPVPEELQADAPVGIIKADAPVQRKLLPTRIVVDHGAINYFGAAGEPLHGSSSKTSTAHVNYLLESLRVEQPTRRLDESEQVMMLEAFAANGFQVRNEDHRFVMIGFPNSDGTESHTIYDRDLQLWRGQSKTDSKGQLINRSTLYYDETDPDLPLIGQEFAFYFDSPSSGNRFVKRSQSTISNFTINQ